MPVQVAFGVNNVHGEKVPFSKPELPSNCVFALLVAVTLSRYQKSGGFRKLKVRVTRPVVLAVQLYA